MLSAHLPARLPIDYCLKIIRSIARRIVVNAGRSRQVNRLYQLTIFVAMLLSFVISIILELSPYALPSFLSERLFELIENKSVKVVRRKYIVICDDITCSRHLFDLLSSLTSDSFVLLFLPCLVVLVPSSLA